jgi:hypothetical protein
MPGLSRTVCAQPSRAHLATASGVQAMVVRYGSSTRGPWDGPVICNEINWYDTHNNPAKGAKQKSMHYINYFHNYHYLLEKLMKIMKTI